MQILGKGATRSFISEVDFKSKVGCFGAKSSQVVLVTSRRLQVDFKSFYGQVESDLLTEVTPRSTSYDDVFAFAHLSGRAGRAGLCALSDRVLQVLDSSIQCRIKVGAIDAAALGLFVK